jgi:multiple sugar transport system permease protein
MKVTQAGSRGVRRARAGYLFIAPAYALFVAFLLLPLAAGIVLSFVQTNFVTFAWVGFDNFEEAFGSRGFQRGLLNTFFYVGVGVPATLIISLTIALLIHPLAPRLHGFFRAAFYLPTVAGGVVLSIAFLWIFNSGYGLLNWLLTEVGLEPIHWLADPEASRWAVVMVLLTHTIGQPVILFLAGLANIPPDISDAAAVDGAGMWRRTWSISLPLLRPVILFVTVIMTIGIFQIWETIFVLTSGGPANASTSIVYEIFETAFLRSNYGVASAMAVVLMVVVFAFTTVQLRLGRGSYLE